MQTTLPPVLAGNVAVCIFKRKIMPFKRLYILFTSLFFLGLSSYAQLQAEYDSLVTQANRFYGEDKYDSALSRNLKAVKITLDNKDNVYFVSLSAPLMLNTGNCYMKLNDAVNAHKFMSYSLKLARANKLPIDINNAFIALNGLHQLIRKKNLPFSYPSVTATEETPAFFSISKVEKLSADSIRITISAGRNDGILDSVKKGGVVSRFNAKEKNRPYPLVNCYVRELHDNYIIAHATNDTALQVREGDLVELKTRMPLSWRKMDARESLRRAIYFTDNYKQPVFDFRYLYYYADSLTNKEIVGAAKSQVDEIVNMLAEDTAKGEYVHVKGDKGIFAGQNVMRAMSQSDERHIKLFFEFVSEFSRTYAGTPYKFSEVYATWVINNTPLDPNSVMPWLLSIANRQSRQQMAANLADDITKNELIDKWFSNGMMMANTDNIDSAFYMAQLIADAATALSEKAKTGWASYLSAYTEKKLGNTKKADTLFRQSLQQFKSSGNKEGETWAINALKTLNSSNQPAVTVQTGHLFSYLIAPSPNPRYMATAGSYDKTIKVWDMTQNRTIASFTAHDRGITSLHYSPNGRYIVSASIDQTIKVWNAFDFSLLKTFNTKETELDVIFSPDSKTLVAGGTDSAIKFMDLNTGAIQKTFRKHRGAVTSLQFMPNNSDYLFSSGRDSMVYKWDLEANDWNHWYSAKGKIMQVSISNNGKYMSLLCSDSMIRVWNLETNKFYFYIRPHYSTGENPDIASPSFSPDSKYMALALRKDSLCIIELATLKEQTYTYKTQNNEGMFDMFFSSDGNYLVSRLSLGGPMRIFNFSGWDFHTNPSINLKEIKTYANAPLALHFTKDDNSIVVVHEAISKFDLQNGSTTYLYSGAHYLMNNYILLNDEKTGLYVDLYSPTLFFYDFINKKMRLEVKLPDRGEELAKFELSGDNKYVYLAGKNNTVAGFKLPTGELLFTKKFKSGEETGFNFIRYDSIRKRLYILDRNNSIIVTDAFNGNILSTIVADAPQSLEVTPLYLYVACNNSTVNKYDAKTLKLLKKIKVLNSSIDCYGSVMSDNYRYLVVQVGDKMVGLDAQTDKKLYERYDHDYQNGTMCISHNNRMLATGGFDNKVNIYDLLTGKMLGSIYTPRGKDFMLVDADGNYLAPKNTLDAVNFNFNNNSYGFEQFDSRFNKPDVVLKKFERASPELLRSYEAARYKRLKKLNISEKDLVADAHLPVARLKDKFALRPGTSSNEYELTIECFDAKYPLRSLQVMVNNNPVFGAAGKPVPGSVNSFTIPVKIPLSVGNNKVKVFCTNSKGSVSLSENIEINSSYTPEKKPKTYFIGIAVSSYKDTAMNLRFAAKDVRDLAASFGKIFQEYEADTLIDNLVTKENILALRTKLMNTTVNDKVIISVNGHGLLSDSLDFYYATYDVDFTRPAARGLKYEDLESLLDGIPARKKLLLIDACHSGSLDKEELLAQQKKQSAPAKQERNNTDTVRSFAPRGTIIRNTKAKADAGSSYEVMQNLFADLSAGNGAVIISAAGGMEYAFESDTWNNGVFTYCIRRGIEEELADKENGNSDKSVDVAELKEYVSRKVSELTAGKQRPVSRRENIEYKWVIW